MRDRVKRLRKIQINNVNFTTSIKSAAQIVKNTQKLSYTRPVRTETTLKIIKFIQWKKKLVKKGNLKKCV